MPDRFSQVFLLMAEAMDHEPCPNSGRPIVFIKRQAADIVTATDHATNASAPTKPRRNSWLHLLHFSSDVLDLSGVFSMKRKKISSTENGLDAQRPKSFPAPVR